MRPVAILAFALAIGCGAVPQSEPAPLDRFTFPTGLAVRDQSLLVVSSNVDLHYDRDTGGSLLQVDPAVVSPQPLAVQGGARIGSFGGEIAIEDDAACTGVAGAGAFALVPSRLENTLYRIGLPVAPDVDLAACGASCVIPLDAIAHDAYGVTVACRGGRPFAFVTYLNSTDGQGWVSEVDLTAQPAPQVQSAPLGIGYAHSVAYDAEHDRIYLTAVSAGLSAPLRWIDLGSGCAIDVPAASGGCPVQTADLFTYVRGAELTGIALSNPQPGVARRIYLTARLFDADVAATIGGRPNYDVGGALIVLEVQESAFGQTVPVFLKAIPIGLGAGDVRVLPPRPGKRDVVAATATDAGVLYLYDDDAGAVARIFARDPTTGAPVLGRKPFGIAVQDRGATARLYIGGFESSFVTPVDVPLASPGQADLVVSGQTIERIGEQP